MKLQIKGLERLDELNTSLKDKRVQKAMLRTLNKTANRTRAEAQKIIKKQYALKLSASELKSKIRITFADMGSLEAKLSVRKGKGEGLSLISAFGANATKKGVRVRILKSAPKALLGKKKRRAFIMRPKKGGVFVAVRKDAVRSSYIKMGAVSLGHILNKISPQVSEYWEKTFEKVFKQELNFALKIEKK